MAKITTVLLHKLSPAAKHSFCSSNFGKTSQLGNSAERERNKTTKRLPKNCSDFPSENLAARYLNRKLSYVKEDIRDCVHMDYAPIVQMTRSTNN